MRKSGPRAMTLVDTHIAKRVFEARRKAGLSQERLANAVGVRFQQLQKYERGQNRISAGRLYAIASALKVPIVYFYEGLPK